MPTKRRTTKTDQAAAIAGVDAAIEAVIGPATEPEPVAEPTPEPVQTGRDHLTKRLMRFAADASERHAEETAMFLDRFSGSEGSCANPMDAIQCRGRYVAAAQAAYEIGLKIKDRFDYAESYGRDPLEHVAADLANERERILRGYYAASSTCQMHNAIQREVGIAIGELLIRYDGWVEQAAAIDADLAAKADQAEALKVELAPGVTMADYEALRRAHRTEQLRATNIDDVVTAFKAAGLKYLGQRKVDLIRMLVNHEFKV